MLNNNYIIPIYYLINLNKYDVLKTKKTKYVLN